MPELTPSQTVGPYFALGLTRQEQHELVPRDTPGALVLFGRVTDGAGEPVNDAVVELWQAGEPTLWGRSATDVDGRFQFVTVKPPARGGEAPHAEVQVFARGLLRHIVTRVYFPDEEEANAADPLLASLDSADRRTLVAQPEEAALRFDIRLQGERQTVFLAV